MGLCLSHCGEAQHKAAVVAVSISHHSASPARPSRSSLADVQQHDPSSTPSTHQSLKRFLHLYNDGSESRKLSLSASPRPSLEDSLAIPHSSELFSLPSDGEGEGSGSDRSRSPSPARGSITSSVARSSTSSRGHRPGRFSTDKPPIPPRGPSNAARPKSSTPARKSCSSLGQVLVPVPTDPPPHKSLVETIARLEKFCDVKLFLGSRNSNSNSPHELSTATGLPNSILLHESCRDLAQKLLCFANEHADGILSRCDSTRETKLESAAAGVVASEPLETSVASFLTEVENFVSKVDAAAPDGERPGDEAVTSRLPSLRFQDADEIIQFTDFEATFELLSSPESMKCLTSAPTPGSDHRSVEPDQPSGASISAEDSNSAPLALSKPARRHSTASADLGGVHHATSNPKGSQQKGPKNSTGRSALSEISSNVRKNQLRLLKAQSSPGMQRGGSRSLDLENCSLSQLAFDTRKSERWQSTLQDAAAATLSTEESQRIEAAADSAAMQKIAGEREVCNNAISPSADAAAPPQSQPTKGRVSVDGEESERQVQEDANEGDEMPNTPRDNYDVMSDKSLSMAFDNLFKLLQSPPGELAHNTAQLLELLGAKTAIAANASHGIHTPPAPSCEAERWHDAPVSLITTEQLEPLPSPSQPH